MTQRILSVQKTFIAYITAIAPAQNFLATDVFGTGIFH
jgi:hypothetical protein